jgi:hypothetical protein
MKDHQLYVDVYMRDFDPDYYIDEVRYHKNFDDTNYNRQRNALRLFFQKGTPE